MSHVSINVNGLSMVHQDSGGVSAATLPDVCATPPSLTPVPYPNVARSRDLVGGSSQVRADRGRRIALAGSAFARSKGGEPGAAGGVTSGTSGAEATFLSHSFDVVIEGRGVARLTDKMLHNRGNTIDCAGVTQAVVTRGAEEPDQATASTSQLREAERPWEMPLHPPRRGVDTNCRTLSMAYAKHRHHGDFVCRYISGFSEAEASAPGMTMTTGNIRLSREEAGRLGVPIVVCWEASTVTPNVGPNWQSIETHSLELQHHQGYTDALQADANICEAGGEGQPIYFTVDFPVSEKIWHAKVQDVVTGQMVTKGQLVTKYFDGIKHAFHGEHRIGVYGRYLTVQTLMEAGLARYGWQMTFNHPPYAAAHIHQTTIYPDLRRWGPPLSKTLIAALKGNKKALQQVTGAPQVARLNQARTNLRNGLQKHWGISGAGGLDFDLAVKVDFGQWLPGKPGFAKLK